MIAGETTITFYINGQDAGLAEGGLMAGRATEPVDNNALGGSRIGAEWRDNTSNNFCWPFSGRIDELAIYSVALDLSEIQVLMAQTQ